MAQRYTPIWDDWAEVTRELTAVEKGRLIDAIVAYDNGGSWQQMINGNERYVFPSYQMRLDRYNESCDSRAKNAAKQNKTKQNETKISNENKTHKVKDKAKDKDKDLKEPLLTESKEKRDRFSPPSLEDVTVYCEERRNAVDPQTFIDFYTSKGWKIGNQSMKDWKAAVRTWEKREHQDSKQKRVGAPEEYKGEDDFGWS